MSWEYLLLLLLLLLCCLLVPQHQTLVMYHHEWLSCRCHCCHEQQQHCCCHCCQLPLLLRHPKTLVLPGKAVQQQGQQMQRRVPTQLTAGTASTLLLLKHCCWAQPLPLLLLLTAPLRGLQGLNLGLCQSLDLRATCLLCHLVLTHAAAAAAAMLAPVLPAAVAPPAAAVESVGCTC
jgi:hypothetical protein